MPSSERYALAVILCGIDHRADALHTCTELHTDLPAFVAQITRFSWAPSAPQYDVARSNGSTGPIEHHRTQLASDPARAALLSFQGHIRATESRILDAGWAFTPTRTVDRKLTVIARALRSPMPLQRKTVGDVYRLLGLARLIQLHWLSTSGEMQPELRACRHCGRTDLGATPKAGLCSPCYEFRRDWKRLPSPAELRRFAYAGRWRVRA